MPGFLGRALLAVAIATLLLTGMARGEVILVGDDGELDAALAAAEDGDEIVLAPGTYSGGRYVPGLVGVTLRSEDPENPAVFDAAGVGQGLHLVEPERVTLESLVFLDAGSNGINVDDGGSFESPGETCGLTGLDQDGVADLELSQLGDFGGPTRTVLPLPGSPVVGGGADALRLTYDQRGQLRNVGLCDAGAVERQGGDPDPIFLDSFESGDTSAWSSSMP